MTATALPSQRAAARSKPGALGKVKKLFFPVAPTYLFMIIPAIVLFSFFIIYPMVQGMFWSFTNYVGYGSWKFIGLANYQAAFQDPTIRDSYGFTLLFSVVACILTNAVAMSLAIALNAKIRWRAGFRAIFFIPMVLSGLVVSYIFTFIIGTSVPIIAGTIHFAPLESSILANQHTAWLGIVFVASWVAIPGAIIIFLAGLVSIPSEVYEAASIDGAGPWKQFQKMTFPLLFPFFIINTILTFKAFLNVYDICVGLTGGGPGTATTSVAQTIFSGFFSGVHRLPGDEPVRGRHHRGGPVPAAGVPGHRAAGPGPGGASRAGRLRPEAGGGGPAPGAPARGQRRPRADPAGEVDLVEALGSELVVHFTVDARRVRAEGTASADEEAVTESGEGVARVDPGSPVKVGQRARFAIKTDGMQFFDPGTGEAIWR